MAGPTFSPATVAELLNGWLTSRLPPDALAWLQDRGRAVATGDRKALFLAFGLTVRKTGKADLQLAAADLENAERVRPGWNPRGWTVDQIARLSLILRYPSADATEFVQTLDQLFAAGEVHELVALYQGLPLLPHQPAFQLRCAEGQRTNIKAVFCAIAHGNPYPSEQLSEDQWNQLVLKCLFVGVPLDPVIGLDARANPYLAKMLVDFAHERWAAHRPVSPELWRCVGPFADDAMLTDLERVLTTGAEVERQAAGLALRACPSPHAGELLRAANQDCAQLMTWSQIAATGS
jgi:hypothetical protein